MDCDNVSDAVYVVDDEEDARLSIAAAFAGSLLNVHAFASAEEFVDQLHAAASGCVLVSADLPGMGARALIAEIGRRQLSLAVVVIDRKHDLAKAVDLVRAGAVDVLEHPLTKRRLQLIVRRALWVGA